MYTILYYLWCTNQYMSLLNLNLNHVYTTHTHNPTSPHHPWISLKFRGAPTCPPCASCYSRVTLSWKLGGTLQNAGSSKTTSPHISPSKALQSYLGQKEPDLNPKAPAVVRPNKSTTLNTGPHIVVRRLFDLCTWVYNGDEICSRNLYVPLFTWGVIGLPYIEAECACDVLSLFWM